MLRPRTKARVNFALRLNGVVGREEMSPMTKPLIWALAVLAALAVLLTARALPGLASTGTDVPTVLGLVPSFDEEFDGERLDRARWRTSFGAQGDARATVAQRSLWNNAERQVYVDPDYLGLGIDPFSVDDGALTIAARPLAPPERAAILAELAREPARIRDSRLADVAYASGLLNTRDRFAQQYGYFEIRAKWSAGKGIWPAFWLLPLDGAWPPELDVMEGHGDKPGVVFQTTHSKLRPSDPKRAGVGGSTAEYHRYGMLWTPGEIRYFVDGRETRRVTPPADATKPMYLLANLAIGGHWPGYPDAQTRFPATMAIDWIRVWRLPDGWTDERLKRLDHSRAGN